jgi:hypothetical protein
MMQFNECPPLLSSGYASAGCSSRASLEYEFR